MSVLLHAIGPLMKFLSLNVPSQVEPHVMLLNNCSQLNKAVSLFLKVDVQWSWSTPWTSCFYNWFYLVESRHSSNTRLSVWTQNIKTASTWNTQLQEKCRTCSLRNKEKPFGIVSVAILSLQSISHISIQPISDNTKHGLSHSHILSLPSHQPVRECVERSNAKHDDTFTFYAGPEPR